MFVVMPRVRKGREEGKGREEKGREEKGREEKGREGKEGREDVQPPLSRVWNT